MAKTVKVMMNVSMGASAYSYTKGRIYELPVKVAQPLVQGGHARLVVREAEFADKWPKSLAVPRETAVGSRSRARRG